MKHRIAAWLGGTILFAACATATAQVPVEDFARHAEIFSASLSPTGEYVALAVPTEDGMETRLQVV